MLSNYLEKNTNIDYKEELNSDQKLELIFEYANKIAGERNLDNLLYLMADLGKQLIVADRCTIWLYNKERHELWTKVAHGIDRAYIPADTGIVGHVMNTQSEYFTNNAYKDINFNKEVDKKTGYKTKGLLAIPLYDNEGKIFGAYQAINKMTTHGEFSKDDLKTLRMVASYSEKSISAAMLSEEIENTQKEIIFLMAGIGETRSHETGNHVKRVAEVSALLAQLYGINIMEAELIKIASPMHDIGKVAIPDYILNKPTKLTNEEFKIMKTHTTIGYDLLKSSNREIIKTAAIITHEHHEKWNGEGYPGKLKGDAIHPYGRITAIADVFDALASPRIYKPAWNYNEIKKLFIEEKGEHFDPEMTEIFLYNFDRFVEILKAYRDV